MLDRQAASLAAMSARGELCTQCINQCYVPSKVVHDRSVDNSFCGGDLLAVNHQREDYPTDSNRPSNPTDTVITIRLQYVFARQGAWRSQALYRRVSEI